MLKCRFWDNDLRIDTNSVHSFKSYDTLDEVFAPNLVWRNCIYKMDFDLGHIWSYYDKMFRCKWLTHAMFLWNQGRMRSTNITWLAHDISIVLRVELCIGMPMVETIICSLWTLLLTIRAIYPQPNIIRWCASVWAGPTMSWINKTIWKLSFARHNFVSI